MYKKNCNINYTSAHLPRDRTKPVDHYHYNNDESVVVFISPRRVINKIINNDTYDKF